MNQTVKNLDLTNNYLYKDGFQYFDAYKSLPIQILTLLDHIQPVGARFVVAIKRMIIVFSVKAWEKSEFY